MKKLLITILLSTSIMFAQSAGKSGLAFLKLGFGARNVAMGDLGVATANDVTALNYNPALISNFQNSQLVFTHNELIQDSRSELFGASFSLFNLPFAVGINTTTISDIEIRTQPGEAQSKFNVNYFYASLSTGFNVTENLSLGVTAKYLNENLFLAEANGFGFDFGASYKNIIEGLNIGASLRNIGSMNELLHEKTELPVDLRIGAAYNMPLESLESDVTVTGGFQKYTETEDSHIHFGGEFLFKKMFAVRAGYMTGYESKALTAGLGVFWNSINFDYAFAPYDYDLGSSHTISLMYNFK